MAANATGVAFGVLMYFPTQVEVPIARMFLELGMHRGPLLAHLLADRQWSLQSMLVTGRILDQQRTITCCWLQLAARWLAVLSGSC